MPEKVKKFYGLQRGNAIEEEINKWLEANEGKINIIQRVMNNSSSFGEIYVTVLIFYRDK